MLGLCHASEHCCLNVLVPHLAGVAIESVERDRNDQARWPRGSLSASSRNKPSPSPSRRRGKAGSRRRRHREGAGGTAAASASRWPAGARTSRSSFGRHPRTNTAGAGLCKANGSNHPRMRGEHFQVLHMAGLQHGSSPHPQGARLLPVGYRISEFGIDVFASQW